MIIKEAIEGTFDSVEGDYDFCSKCGQLVGGEHNCRCKNLENKNVESTPRSKDAQGTGPYKT